MTPCLRSSTGMRRGRVIVSIDATEAAEMGEEGSEEVETAILALFSVELHTEEVALLDGDRDVLARERNRRRHHGRIGRCQAEAMDVVEATARAVGEKRAFPRRCHIAPTDVRNPVTRLRRLQANH